MKQLLLLSLLVLNTAFMAAHSQEKESYMLVGTFTSPGKSEGIYVYKFNSETGECTPVSTAPVGNPSYLAISPDEKSVYAVRGGKGGEVSAFTFDKKTGTLSFVNKQSSGGENPCYVEVDKTGKWLFAGNYTSGSLSVFPINKERGLDPSSLIQHTGSGKNPQRQNGPHVHCTVISPDNRWLFVPDLGIDKVMIYAFDAAKGTLTPGKPAFSVAEPGAGPRHFIFHPNGRYAYLIEEMGGNVVTYQYNNGELKPIQRISTIPAGQTGDPGSADIHISPDGKFLYASNRGDFNTLASYSIDAASGKLTEVENIPVLGKSPRNFNLDPSAGFLLIANQQSDEIVIFKRDKETGKLTDTGKRIQVSQPVCIKWISTK